MEYSRDSLEEAIKKQNIKVYYQPVIHTLTGDICSMEALARWNDSDRDEIHTSMDFISELERRNIIHYLDLFMVREICSDMKQACAAGIPILPVSFNLSYYDFLECNMFQEIEQIVSAYDIDRNYLIIEFTEAVLLEDIEQLKIEMKHFVDAGYQICIDDFGSGHSSLNAWREFEFEEIKIDMLAMYESNERARQIVKAFVSMARGLGVRTIAKGVETEEQSRFFREIGCEKQQGYLLGVPMPLEYYLDEKVKNSLKIFRSQIAFSNMKTAYQNQLVMEEIIEHIPAAIIIFAMNRKKEPSVVYISDYIRKIVGSDAGEDIDVEALLQSVIPLEREHVERAAYESFCNHRDFDRIFRIKDALGNITWAHLVTKAVPQPDGGCLFYGVYTDVTAEKINEEQEMQSQTMRVQRYQNMVARLEEGTPQGLALKVHLDGTDNKIISWWKGEDGYDIDPNFGWGELRDFILAHAFSDADRRHLWNRIDIEGIFKELETQGYSTRSAEYLRNTPSGKVIWTRAESRSIEDPITHHVNNYFFFYNVGEDMIPTIFANQMIRQDFEMVALHNIAKDTVQLYEIDGRENVNVVMRNGYMSICEEYAKSYIYPEDYEKFMWIMNIKSAIMELETSSGVYHVGFWTNYGNERRRKLWRFSYVNDQRDCVLIARNDITDSYVDEEVYTHKIDEITNELEELNRDVTGVLTRRAALYEIRRLIDTKKSGRFTVVMIDLDNLKYVNDTFGHPMGDFAINSIAEILQSSFRNTDVVGRIGGDEFMVFCDEADPEVIEKKVREVIQKVNTVVIRENRNLGCSIGYLHGQHGRAKFEEVYAKVDQALYQAKKEGKNQAREAKQ